MAKKKKYDIIEPKDKAAIYLELIDAARKRITDRQDVEVKFNIPLWTVLTVGGGFVLSSSEWTPSKCMCIGATIAIAIVLYFYIFYFNRWLSDSNLKDAKVSYAWEIEIHSLFYPRSSFFNSRVKDKRPAEFIIDHLKPAEFGYEQEAPKESLHPVQKCEALVTILFSIWFVSAFWISFSGNRKVDAQKKSSKENIQNIESRSDPTDQAPK